MALVIPLETIKTHLRILHHDEDALITSYALAAQNFTEFWQGRSLLQQELVEYYDAFPETIRPPYPPLVSIDSIQYVDVDGETQTVSSGDYRVDTNSEPGRITPAYSKTWPATRNVTNAVIVTCQAGYVSADKVPEEIKQALLLLIAHFYEHRESVTEVKLVEVPQAYYSLLWPRRILMPVN